MPRASKLAVAVCLTFWTAGILLGTHYANSYSNTAGISAPPVDRWPIGTALHRAPNVSTLLVAIHPQCPCSSASVEALRKAVEQSGEHPVIYALVYQPADKYAEWAETSLVQALRDIPAAKIVIDRNGAEIDRFHARVSGEVFLYDAIGRLRFKGGVTARRGHVGESQGSEALTALLGHSDLPYRETPVFGCSLRHSPETAGVHKE